MQSAGSSEALRLALSDCRSRLQRGEIALRVPLGQARPRPPEFGHFHIHPELFYQLSGRTVFQFPSERLVLEPGTLLLVPPLVTHAERAEMPAGEPFRNLVAYAGNGVCSVHFAEAGADSRPAIAYIRRPSYGRAVFAASYLADAVEAAERSAPARRGSYDDPREALPRALVAAALCEFECALDVPPSKGSGLPALAEEAGTLVAAALSDTELSVARLARWLGCSADYLSHLYKISAGESLASYIVRKRLERADELLRDTSLSIKEVSWACGFSQVSYFIRKFKERYGETPKSRRTGRGFGPALRLEGPSSAAAPPKG